MRIIMKGLFAQKKKTINKQQIRNLFREKSLLIVNRCSLF